MIDDKQTAEVYKKIVWRLIPFLCFCYLASYLDRINVGFAKLQMQDYLSLSETAYGLGAGLFFVGYIVFEVPSNVVLQRVGAKIWIARIMISWGVLSGLTMFVTTPMQFYIIRFLLGAAEAGFLPGVLFYLTTWFPSYRRGRIISFFMIGLPLSSVIGGPLSGWIMAHFANVFGLQGWQWLFLLEALPTIILGFMTFFILPNNHHQAHWLNQHEKDLVTQALKTDEATQTSSKSSILDGLLNIKVWMLGGIDFAILLSTYALGFWLPTFIRHAGINDIVVIGYLTAIPSLAAVFGMLFLGASSDKYRERRYHIIIPFLIGCLAMISSTFFSQNIYATILLFTIASCMITGAVPVFLSLPATFLSGKAAATGFAMAISIANIAGLVSNSLVGLAIDLTGSSAYALWLFAFFLVVGCIFVYLLPAKVVNR